jgi:hypothetical protein
MTVLTQLVAVIRLIKDYGPARDCLESCDVIEGSYDGHDSEMVYDSELVCQARGGMEGSDEFGKGLPKKEGHCNVYYPVWTPTKV